MLNIFGAITWKMPFLFDFVYAHKNYQKKLVAHRLVDYLKTVLQHEAIKDLGVDPLGKNFSSLALEPLDA